MRERPQERGACRENMTADAQRRPDERERNGGSDGDAEPLRRRRDGGGGACGPTGSGGLGGAGLPANAVAFGERRSVPPTVAGGVRGGGGRATGGGAFANRGRARRVDRPREDGGRGAAALPDRVRCGGRAGDAEPGKAGFPGS